MSKDGLEWLYFPHKDQVVTFDAVTGVESPDDEGEYGWRWYTKKLYMEFTAPLTVDQKLDRIIKMLENK